MAGFSQYFISISTFLNEIVPSGAASSYDGNARPYSQLSNLDSDPRYDERVLCWGVVCLYPGSSNCVHQNCTEFSFRMRSCGDARLSMPREHACPRPPTAWFFSKRLNCSNVTYPSGGIAFNTLTNRACVSRSACSTGLSTS